MQAHLAQLRVQLDARLASLLPGAGAAAEDPVGAAMRYGALAPGKRVRPLLLLLACEDLGGASADALDLACALELVHAASLLVDDLPCMDNATLRRGQPTVHVRFGQDVAILAAIGLLGLAFRTAAAAVPLPPDVRASCVALLADAVGTSGLVQGQYRDLHGARHPDCTAAIAQTNHLKTGALFAAALALAALVCRVEPRVGQGLQAFAVELGQAFQLSDDLGDMTASAAELGKDVGRDAARPTLPALLGVSAAQDCIRMHWDRGRSQLDDALGPASRLVQFARLLLPGAAAAAGR
ncbi:geranylgeranyl pyrophosphate synthase [Pulveribacter suum]|uniref:Geranylgeranyl pyrophosphate synthase n=1 Tax=Pulveribacter suum TaxID=2116657 RepID=A0A2P1NMW0_9BURK|nr:geranylgeranyl pyrophosphate synthase [Pulveribacter suum]